VSSEEQIVATVAWVIAQVAIVVAVGWVLKKLGQ